MAGRTEKYGETLFTFSPPRDFCLWAAAAIYLHPAYGSRSPALGLFPNYPQFANDEARKLLTDPQRQLRKLVSSKDSVMNARASHAYFVLPGSQSNICPLNS